MEEVRTKLEQKPFIDAIQQAEEDLRADRRWLNSLFTSRLDILAARFADGEWTLADQTVADALCSPWCEAARGQELILATGHVVPLSPEVKAARNAGLQLLIAEHRERHERSLKECADITARIASRRYLVDIETCDLVAVRQAALDDAIAQGMETSDQGFTRSRFRAIRYARDMAHLHREIRLKRLDGIAEEIRDPKFSEYKTLALTLE
jgi:ATP-dependent helicase HepA